MKNRKRIAVIMCDIHHTYQKRIIQGLITQAHALDYDVAVFTMFMNIDEETNYQYGENNVFHLINYDLFDAVIYAPCSIEKRALREFFAQELKEKCRVPIVALEFEDESYHMVAADDTASYENMVSHLIEHHHLERILCLTGFKGNLQAEARLQGYRNAMAHHGLTVRENDVIYGDFWQAAALELAQKLADGEIEMPQAVVCVSDFVAATLCNRLIELGIRVPEDIFILGYDITKESADNVPSITSFSRPLEGLGIQAILLAHQLLTGEVCKPIKEDRGYLVTGQSCGCGEDITQRFRDFQKHLTTVTNHHTLFNRSHMAESLNSSQTLNRCLGKIIDYLYLVQGIRDYYLCLCDQWDDLDRTENNGDDYKHYTDTMHLQISCKNHDASIVDVPFQRSQLLPALHEESDIPHTYFFTPLHFNERCLGYAAVSYEEDAAFFDDIYHSWTRNINNALEFVRVRNVFSSMHQRLYMASIRDTLTGIFNRKGFNRFSSEIFRKAVKNGRKLLVIAADLDCLKPINDNFGHLEGDNAISVIANALNTCFDNDEICARTGGDEFIAIGCADYTDEIIAQYMKRLRQSLQRYNSSSEKPYTVDVSIGYVCRNVTEQDRLQDLLDEADARMYENKNARRKNRQ